jgi:hypothetical protein
LRLFAWEAPASALHICEEWKNLQGQHKTVLDQDNE